MNEPGPNMTLEPCWDEARVRAEQYLKALGVTHPERIERISLIALQRAKLKHLQAPTEKANSLVMTEVRKLLADWFVKIGRPISHGLVSLMAIDTATRWPGAFLNEGFSPDFVEEMRGFTVRAVPDLQISCMIPQPFTNPIDSVKLSGLAGLFGYQP